MTSTILTLFSSVWLATAPAAHAPRVAAADLVRPGTASFTVYAGTSLPMSDYRTVANGGSSVGIAGNYHMTSHVDLSADLAYARNDGVNNGVSETIAGQGQFTADESWTASWLGGHASWRMLTAGLPYARLGAGVYHLKYRLDALNPTPTSLKGGDAEQSRLGANLGAGASFRLTPGTRLGLEAVYHRVFVTGVSAAYTTVGLTMTFAGGR